MKKIFLSTVLMFSFISASVHAVSMDEKNGFIQGNAARLIYEGLEVPIQNMLDGIEEMFDSKEIGGIKCTSLQTEVLSEPVYKCTFRFDLQDAEAIYAALVHIPEVPINGGINGNAWKKSVGGLTCYKRTILSHPEPAVYNCTLDRT